MKKLLATLGVVGALAAAFALPAAAKGPEPTVLYRGGGSQITVDEPDDCWRVHPGRTAGSYVIRYCGETD